MWLTPENIWPVLLRLECIDIPDVKDYPSATRSLAENHQPTVAKKRGDSEVKTTVISCLSYYRCVHKLYGSQLCSVGYHKFIKNC